MWPARTCGAISTAEVANVGPSLRLMYTRLGDQTGARVCKGGKGLGGGAECRYRLLVTICEVPYQICGLRDVGIEAQRDHLEQPRL
jgi:hypothetical protein